MEGKLLKEIRRGIVDLEDNLCLVFIFVKVSTVGD